MSALVVTPVLDDVFTAVGNFLIGALGAIQVVRGVVNRVPLPAADCVVMTAVYSGRLRTNVNTWDPDDPDPALIAYEKGTRVDIQLDFYGGQSNAWATIIETLWRDDYACVALGDTCQPLYGDEARQIPLVTGEEQYLERWLLNITLQYNPVTSAPAQFADAATVNVINVDERYPP